MTDIIKARRKGFEAHCRSVGWEDRHLKRSAKNPEKYDDWSIQPLWMAYNAALDSVCVELPISMIPDEYGDVCEVIDVDDMRQAIERAGLKVNP